MKEVWRSVEGYGDFYEVSNLGRVRSYHGNHQPRRDEPHVLKPGSTVRGYLFVLLRDGDGGGRSEFVHRLVAGAFIGKPSSTQESPTVNHKDLNRRNNRASNLEWLSHADNIRHAAKIIPRLRGEDHPASKLTAAKVLEIRRRWASRESVNKLAIEYGVSSQTIWLIAVRRKWKHVPSTG